MFFEQELISFCLLDVLKLKQKNVNMWNCGRNFNTLSFRFAADTRLKTKNNEYHMKENYLSYVPARLDYSRQSKTEDLIAIHFNTTNYNTKNIEYFIPTDPTAFANLFREIWSVWEKKGREYRKHFLPFFCRKHRIQIWKTNLQSTCKIVFIQGFVFYGFQSDR